MPFHFLCGCNALDTQQVVVKADSSWQSCNHPIGPTGVLQEYYDATGWVLDVLYYTPAAFISGITSTLATREWSAPSIL